MSLFGRIKRAATGAVTGLLTGGPAGALAGAAGGALTYKAPAPKRTPAQALAGISSSALVAAPSGPRNPYQSSGPGLDAGDVLEYFDRSLGGVPGAVAGAVQRGAYQVGYNQQAGQVLKGNLGPNTSAQNFPAQTSARGVTDEYGRPIVTGVSYQTRTKAPKGYVTVVNPNTGEKVAMLRDVAIRLGYYKPRRKPYLSYADMKSLRKAESVKRKVQRAAAKADFVTRKKK